MSRIYDALQVPRGSRPAKPLSQGGVANSQDPLPANPPSPPNVVNSPDLPAENKQGPSPSRRKRSGALPLFHANLEENFKLWVENCFPDAAPSREDAIRQWLAKPPEFRAQAFMDYRVKSQKSDNSVTAAAPQEEATEDNSRALTDDRKNQSEQHSQRRDDHANERVGSRSVANLLLGFAKYSILFFVIVGIVWAAARDRKVIKGDASFAAGPIQKPDPSVGSGAQGLQQDRENAQRANLTAQPMEIQSLTLGCGESEPCIQINSRGGESNPSLSMLTDPDRLVLDFSNTVYSADSSRITGGRGPIKGVRISQTQSDDQSAKTRVVIDLSEPSDYQTVASANRFLVTIHGRESAR